MYPAFTKSNYLENTIDPHTLFDGIRPTSNFQNYIKAARACHPIVHENGEITKGINILEWNFIMMDLVYLLKDRVQITYCKKWFSKGCNNTRQHPDNLHYAEHTLKSCKMASCPKCFVDWINKQSNRSTQRCMKFLENKQYKFRHIVLSPPPNAKDDRYKFLKKWLSKILKEANIQND